MMALCKTLTPASSPLFNESPESVDARLSDAERVADGGAAMTAYAHLQHVELHLMNATRYRRVAALLRAGYARDGDGY